MTEQPSTPSVLIVDDHGLIREGLRLMLARQGIEVVGEAADGAAAVVNARSLRPNVVLMDLRMPGVDGVSATRQIVSEQLADVIVLTSFDEDELVFAAIQAGAAGFLLKTTEAGALAAAIRGVAAGDGVLDPRVTRRALAALAAQQTEAEHGHRERHGIEHLTAREREVLEQLREGRSNTAIALRLGISVPTVKTHVSNILVKLGAESRTQVVAMLSG